MRIRSIVVAIAAGTALLVPATARAGDLAVASGHDGVDFVRYFSLGSANDVTFDAKYPGNPVLTADEPGVQRIDVSDARDTVSAFWGAGGTPAPGCSNASDHSGFCLADPQEEAAWRTSTCYYPPGCTGPGPSGLLTAMYVTLWGTDVKLRDTRDAVAIDENISLPGDGSHETTLWSALGVNYRATGNASDRVILRLRPLPLRGPSNTRSVDTGPGNDFVFARDGTPESIGCGDGNDSVIAGAEDTVAADCENVFAG